MSFEKDLAALVHQHKMDAAAGIPDAALAQYLVGATHLLSGAIKAQPAEPTPPTPEPTPPTPTPTPNTIPELINPAPNAVLDGSSVTFRWRNNGLPVTQWNLRVGDGTSISKYTDTRFLNPEEQSFVVSGLPSDGRTIHTQLAYKSPEGQWTHVYQRAVAGSENKLPTQWDMSVTPPTLENPLIYALSPSTGTTDIDDYDHLGCAGKIHRFDLPAGRDAVFIMAPDADPIGYPVWIVGGRHVHVIGLEMRTLTQQGCAVGDAHQYRDPANKNIHPRVPSSAMLRLQNDGVSFIEGVHIDLLGHEADAIVARNTKALSFEQAKQQREFYIVNSRITGIEGLHKTKIGDGVHGDLFQNQGEPVGKLVFENVTCRSSSNGITHHGWRGFNLREFKLRNFDYGWDLRYSADDAYETSGLAFVVYADAHNLENVWIDHGRNANYGMISDQRWGAVGNGSYILKHKGISGGPAPKGEFAPANRVGRHYVSPFPNTYNK